MPSHTVKERAKKALALNKRKQAKARASGIQRRKQIVKKSPAAKVVARRARNRRRGR